MGDCCGILTGRPARPPANHQPSTTAPMTEKVSRRTMLACGAGAAAALALPHPAHAGVDTTAGEPFRYCLNSGTIRGQKLGIVGEIEVAAQAGYSGIEPWVGDIQNYVEAGGSLSDLRKRLDDLGLTVESAIGFPAWVAEDERQRARGLEQMRREMDLIAALGGKRIAAPPAGAPREGGVPLMAITERYRAVLELGRQTGVVPQLETWGPSPILSRLGQAAFVVAEADDADACLLLDVYHIYKSGSGFLGLRQLNGAAMRVFHMNDYPADPPRETIGDADRIMPGDGIAPMRQILRDLYETGFRGALSLELFNRTYWEQDALEVARLGLAKMQEAVAAALES